MLHNDPNLDNVVFRDGRAVALIDFDLASPGPRVWDVAARPGCGPRCGWTSTWTTPGMAGLHRFRRFVDSYGLNDEERAVLVDAVIANHDWMVGVVADGAAHGVPGFAAYWGPDAAARARRTDAWLGANAAEITAALLPD